MNTNNFKPGDKAVIPVTVLATSDKDSVFTIMMTVLLSV